MTGHEVSVFGPGAPGYGGLSNPPRDESLRELARQPSIDAGIPIIDTTQALAHSGSGYGSPREANIRHETALTTTNKGLSALDAPLPASFDSNGVSHVARYPDQPMPASVPNQFGLGTFSSPSPSVRASETLRALHNSAFGPSNHLSPGGSASAVAESSSPANGELRRANMHSSRSARPRMISASVPKQDKDGDWEAGFSLSEEDCVPDALTELLTPTEKARRGSLRADENVDYTASQGQVQKLGNSIPTISPSGRWGTPGMGADVDERNGRPRYGASPYGHVGSPLRVSSLIGSDLDSTAAGTSAARQPPSRRGTSSNESLSALTQQIQRTKLESDSISGGNSPRLRGLNGTVNGRPIGSEREKTSIERHVSSSSGGSGRLAPRAIDEEEEGEFVFDMEVDDMSLGRGSRTIGRKCGGSTGFSPWSYASATASKTAASGSYGHVGAKREPGVIGR